MWAVFLNSLVLYFLIPPTRRHLINSESLFGRTDCWFCDKMSLWPCFKSSHERLALISPLSAVWHEKKEQKKILYIISSVCKSKCHFYYSSYLRLRFSQTTTKPNVTDMNYTTNHVTWGETNCSFSKRLHLWFSPGGWLNRWKNFIGLH